MADFIATFTPDYYFSASLETDANFETVLDEGTSFEVSFGTTSVVSEDKTYVHIQSRASDTWTVVHNLQKYPSVTVVDTANSNIDGGQILYLDQNSLQITFAFPFSGKAYCN